MKLNYYCIFILYVMVSLQICWLFFLLVSMSAGVYQNAEEVLFNDLFLHANYSSDVRPVINKSEPVIVRMNIAYVQLIDLNDRDQSLKSNVWIRQFWKNDFLTWNPDDYGGIKTLTVDKKWLWKPDLILQNGASDNLNTQLDQHKTRIIIQYDGTCSWYIPAIIDSGCSINIKYFPFDYQKCDLVFGSWTYLKHELDLESTRNDIDLSNYLETSFSLLATKAQRNEVKYSCCPLPYVDITFSVVIKRQPYHYIFNVITPSLVLTFFAVFIFAYPEETGERMGLAIQCFLTISILTILVSDMMPIDSDITPLLVQYMTSCMIAMTASLIMNAVSFNLTQTSVPVPAWIHDLFVDKIGAYLLWKSCWSSIQKTGKFNPTALCECFFTSFLRNQQRQLDDNNDDDERDVLLETQKLYENYHDHSSNYFNSANDKCDFCSKTDHIKDVRKRFLQGRPYDSMRNRNSLSLQESIEIAFANVSDMKNLKYLAEKVRDDVASDNNADFWRCFAQTMDRVFLLFFTLLYTVVCVCMFMLVPPRNL